MHAVTSLDCSRIAQDLQIRKVQVESVAALFEEGNTVPFIACYRKERTGGLNEEVIRQVHTRLQFLRRLADRKQTILRSIENQGKLTDDLRQAILAADTTKRLEDLFLPFKPKKAALAQAARQRGLEPLALAIWHGDPAAADLEDLLPGLVNPDQQLAAPEDVRTGMQHLLAEWTAETAGVRAVVRQVLWETGKIASAKSEKLADGQGLEYKEYFQFSEPARQIHAQRISVLNRGEKEGALKIKLEFDYDAVRAVALPALADQLAKVFGKMPAPQSPQPRGPQVQESASPAENPEPKPETTPDAPVAETAPAAGSAPAGSEVAPAPETAPVPPATAEVQPEAPASLGLPTAPQNDWAMTGEVLAEGVDFRTPHVALFKSVLEDALQRLVLPSLEREIRGELNDDAEAHALGIFARNLRSLLLQPPLKNQRVLAIDPNLHSGCKVVVLDEYGNLLESLSIHPFGRARKSKEKGPTKPAVETAAATQSEASSSEAAPAGPVGESTATAVPDSLPATEVTAAASEPMPAAEASTPAEPAAVPVESIASPGEEPPAPVAEAATETPAATAPEPAAPPVDKKAEARTKLHDLLTKHQINLIALGNGHGCREMEEILSETIADLPDVSYVLVNEAGASSYAGSPAAREELPDLDPATRGTLSIGRRLQDPLAELVKIEPIHLGTGLAPHEMARKEVRETLEGVVESCVNQVGVDVNTASVALLRYVSGLNPMVARELVDYRKQHGPFTSRESLLLAPSLATRFVQAAGFLKIADGPNPLDRTFIHPESYPLAEKILADLGFTTNALVDQGQLQELRARLRTASSPDLAKGLGVSIPTVEDLMADLAQPEQDIRADVPPPLLKKGLRKLEDLEPGMELKGTVLNVVDFGAFVDVGLKDSGLVHISQIANRYIKSPYDVVAVNDVVSVWVLSVDKERGRVSLTMIQPGSERRAPERRPEGPRPPRARRPEGPGREGPAPQQGQGHPPEGGQGDSRGSRPPRRGGRGDRRGPRDQRSAPAAAGGPRNVDNATDVTPPLQPRTNLPERKPRREPPKAKLTQAALEGKAPLRTFSELSALFAAKTEKPAPAEKKSEGQAPQVEESQTPAEAPPPGDSGAPS